MPTKKCLSTTNRNITYQVFRLLLVLGVASAVIGCSANLVPAGEDGIRIRSGDLIGKSDDGTFMMQFRIGSDGANIFLITYPYPCGENIVKVFSSNPSKTQLSSNAFKLTIDGSFNSPKQAITGKFIDITHAKGD